MNHARASLCGSALWVCDSSLLSAHGAIFTNTTTTITILLLLSASRRIFYFFFRFALGRGEKKRKPLRCVGACVQGKEGRILRPSGRAESLVVRLAWLSRPVFPSSYLELLYNTYIIIPTYTTNTIITTTLMPTTLRTKTIICTTSVLLSLPPPTGPALWDMSSSSSFLLFSFTTRMVSWARTPRRHGVLANKFEIGLTRSQKRRAQSRCEYLRMIRTSIAVAYLPPPPCATGGSGVSSPRTAAWTQPVSVSRDVLLTCPSVTTLELF